MGLAFCSRPDEAGQLPAETRPPRRVGESQIPGGDTRGDVMNKTKADECALDIQTDEVLHRGVLFSKFL